MTIQLGLRGWKFWKSKKNIAEPKEQTIEDITNIRNLHEKMASLNIGQCFGLTTREGIKIFKLVEIRPHQQKSKS